MRCEYIDHMGDDLRVANAARVSFDKEGTYEETEWNIRTQRVEGRISEKDQRLIRYLSTHNHFTPFTHTSITLRETVPIFVARQRFKHTVGFTYNEVSRRYVDSPPEFYVPDVWRKRAENKKQGSSLEELVTELDEDTLDFGLFETTNIHSEYKRYLKYALSFYNSLVQSGVAPEQARMVLPQSMFTSYYVTGSLAAFARAYNLRSKEDAQKEIQELSVHWDNIIRPLFPVSWEALVVNT